MPDRHLWQRHSTKTIALDGTTGNGEAGTVIVFTITGRVLVHAITAFCTEDLVSAGGGTVELGVAADTDAFIAQTTATAVDVNEWWQIATPSAGANTLADSVTGGLTTSQRAKTVSTNIIITVGTADVTDGTIVFDVIYTPLTDGGRLA